MRGVARSAACLVLLLGSVPGARAEGASSIGPENLARYADSAQTAQDHERLAAYYRSEAARTARERKQHEAMLTADEEALYPNGKSMAAHCRSLIQVFEQAHTAFEDLAERHEDLARPAENQ